MKKAILASATALILMLLIIHPAVAQDHSGRNHESEEVEQFNDVPEAFRTDLTQVVESYLNGKDAFLKSDLEGSLTKFESFKNKLEEIGQHGLSGDGHMAWMESYKQLTGHTNALINSNNIDSARHRFRDLSHELIDTVKKFGIDGVLYQQYCPMAVDNDGATWLSRNEKIQNPFTPNTMQGCGEMIEKIVS